jgi:hypothetical protein
LIGTLRQTPVDVCIYPLRIQLRGCAWALAQHEDTPWADTDHAVNQ